MPLSARHASAGLIDLSDSPINPAVVWSDIYKVKPRAPLTCRECGQTLHPKKSKLGHQFFAHDVAVNCSSVGESMAHRLLKIVLASAIRDAGWAAELEVSGKSWRADVLATRPDGGRRIAFEAQLASTTIDEVSERTARYSADGVEACWVSDEIKVWTTRVPSIVLQNGWITAGLATCTSYACGGTCYAPIAGCPGHSRWPSVTLALQPFLKGLFSNSVFVHQPETGKVIWTTTPHLQQATDLARQADTFDRRRQAALQEGAAHHKRIEALLARQQQLLKPAIDFIFNRDGIYARSGTLTPDWAMGVPLVFEGRPVAVVCPVASRISRRLARGFMPLTIFAASNAERQRIAKACEPRQDIQILRSELISQSD